METSQNDSPTADSIAYLESQGVATDDEDEDDIHFCKKCKQVFKKLDAYLEHKVKHDKFKVAYSRAPSDRRMVLPTLMKKEVVEKPPASQGQGEGSEQADEAKPRKRRKRKGPQLDVQLIAERNTYICTKCDRKFSREASLKCHMEYEHNAQADSDEEEEDRQELEAEEGETQDQNFAMKKEPAAKRIKLSSDNDRPFQCEVCGMGFKEIAVLKTHMLTHSNVRQYKCTYENCPYAFKTKGSLVRHIRRHTGERPYTCESCHRKFAESGALTRHMRSRNPCTAKTDADLPRYGKKWTYVPNIPAVVSQDKNGDGFVSMVPGEMVMVVTEGENGEQILTEAQVVSNNETVSSLGENVMEEGEVAESEVGELVAASDLHTYTSTQCRVCREECLEMEALRAHLRLHLADFPFHCGLCHFTTEDRQDLRNHMQSKHLRQLKGIDPSILMPPAEGSASKDPAQPSSKDNTDAQTAVKQLLELPTIPTSEAELTETLSTRAISRCPICNRAFRGTSYLKQHMKSHTGERPHECLVCHKSFVTKDALNKHLIVHTDERNFKCGECGKLFKRIGHVREHLKIHNAERPFPCTVCDKSFKTNNALKVHIRTHSDVYPYECRMCHRQFREKGSLQRHLRTHTGERPFRCNRCGRGFAEHGTLNRHLKAKVQCNQHSYQSVEVDEPSLEQQIQEGEEQQEATADIPTVLTEFSSVVADTQQYIVADHLAEGDTQTTTEYVVLHTDLVSDDIQNVEIVTEGDIDTDAILNTVAGNENYMVVNDPGNQLHFIDSSTGLTLATMPADSEGLSAVTMMPGNEVGQNSVTLQADSGTGILKQGEVIYNSKTDSSLTVLSAPDVRDTITVQAEDGSVFIRQQEGASSESSKMESVAVMTTSARTDSITVHTDAGHITVVGEEEVADAIKHAMMVADVMDSAGSKTGSGEVQVVLTHSSDLPDITHTLGTQQ